MKVLLIKHKKRFIGMVVCAVLLALLLVNAIGYIFDNKYISVFAANKQIDNYQIKSELLIETMDDVGVCYPGNAAMVWANGLKGRNGAAQYSVMTSKLKKEYAKQLDENYPNWVTGGSSPWIQSFEISEAEKADENTYLYSIVFSTMTSQGPWGDYNAKITVVKDDDFYRISEIEADKELEFYMGFAP